MVDVERAGGDTPASTTEHETARVDLGLQADANVRHEVTNALSRDELIRMHALSLSANRSLQALESVDVVIGDARQFEMYIRGEYVPPAGA